MRRPADRSPRLQSSIMKPAPALVIERDAFTQDRAGGDARDDQDVIGGEIAFADHFAFQPRQRLLARAGIPPGVWIVATSANASVAVLHAAGVALSSAICRRRGRSRLPVASRADHSRVGRPFATAT